MAKIAGNIAGLPNPQPDWNQKDKTKADYIKNKPSEGNYCNALIGVNKGLDAVRIDDISPFPHNIKVIRTRKNLISSPFGEINVENGKTYTLSFKIKDDVTLSGAYYLFCWFDEENNWRNEPFIESEQIWNTSFTFTAGELGYSGYYIEQSNMTEDMFEYVQLEEGTEATSYTPYIADISTVGFKSYGKNISGCRSTVVFDDWYSFKTEENKTRYAYDLNIPNVSCIMTISLNDNLTGTLALQCSTDGGKTWDRVGGYIYQSSGSYEVKTFTRITNALYRMWGTDGGAKSVTNIQVELGSHATYIETYQEPVEGAKAIYPITTLVADEAGVILEATYSKDINKVIAALEEAIANS